MFRIQGEAEMSKADRIRQRVADERFAAALARSLASYVRPGFQPSKPQKLARIARFIVEPVTTRARLHKARRAGVARSHRVAVVNPNNMWTS